MRLLHVGSGYRPLRRGGLVAYVEDLIAEQVRRGHEVSYLFSGRYFRRPRGIRLKRWRRHGAEMLEIVNSPLYDHGRQPALETSEPQLDRIFERLLAELRPDVVHVQELPGLPFSLLDVARESSAPVVMTLQDYFPLCSTFKLLDADGRVCLRREIGADCVATVQADRRRPNLLYEGTLRHLIYRTPVGRMQLRHSEPLVQRVLRSRLAALPDGVERETPSPKDFQRRREVNLERLNRVDRLIAMSQRVADIYAELGVDRRQLTPMQLTLAHASELTPREPSGQPPVTFATLGAGESVAKGSRVLLQAARQVAAEAPQGSFRLLILGHVEPALLDVVAPLAEVELRGTYRSDQLDRLLDEVDVGIMPSIWEEAYGYAGIEFIAKGIPVIGNRIGGIPEYVRDGKTGWLNRSNSGRGLAEIMLRLGSDPALVAKVSQTTRAARDELVISMSNHADELERLYEEVLEVSRRSAASRG